MNAHIEERKGDGEGQRRGFTALTQNGGGKIGIREQFTFLYSAFVLRYHQNVKLSSNEFAH